MVQWLRTHLPEQGTWVPASVQEAPTCQGAIKPMSTQAVTTKAQVPKAYARQQEEPLQWKALTLQLESSPLLPKPEKTRPQQ